MQSQQKKPLAVVMATDDKAAFAAGCALLSLKANSPLLFKKANIIIYYQNLSQQNRKALRSIGRVFFKEYKLNFSTADIKTIRRYSQLTLARYECFFLLKEYKQLLWLDLDILVKKELINILKFKKSGFAMAHDDNIVASNFLKPIKGFDLLKRNFNAGVIVFSENMANPVKVGAWCYQQTKALANKLFWIDQGILNLALQKFSIKPAVLPRKFNSHPVLSPIKTDNALILHAMGNYKFWDNYPFKEWDKFYSEWLGLGGAEVTIQNYDKKYLLMFKFKLFLEKVPFIWGFSQKILSFKFALLNNKTLKTQGLKGR